MRIGITSTRQGLTSQQFIVIGSLFKKFDLTELHHGDCEGGDFDIHCLTRRSFPQARIIIHPPEDDSKRAFCLGDERLEPRPYLERNRAVVIATDLLIGAPAGEEITRSGTWSTIRYAQRNRNPFIVVMPDGRWS